MAALSVGTATKQEKELGFSQCFAPARWQTQTILHQFAEQKSSVLLNAAEAAKPNGANTLQNDSGFHATGDWSLVLSGGGRHAALSGDVGGFSCGEKGRCESCPPHWTCPTKKSGQRLTPPHSLEPRRT